MKRLIIISLLATGLIANTVNVWAQNKVREVGAQVVVEVEMGGKVVDTYTLPYTKTKGEEQHLTQIKYVKDYQIKQEEPWKGAVEHIYDTTPAGTKVLYDNGSYDLKVYVHEKFESVKTGRSGIIEILKPIGQVYGANFFPEDGGKRVKFLDEPQVKAYYTLYVVR